MLAPTVDRSGKVEDGVSVVRSSCETRPERFSVVVTSATVPTTWRALASVWAVTGTGPQSWKGEITSYGSGTDTRYGVGLPPQASALELVSPPEVEEKTVVATAPL